MNETTPPIMTINDELLAELEAECETRVTIEIGRQAMRALLQHVRELKADAERWRHAKSDTSAGKTDVCVVKKIWGNGQQYTQEFILTGERADQEVDAARSIAD